MHVLASIKHTGKTRIRPESTSLTRHNLTKILLSRIFLAHPMAGDLAHARRLVARVQGTERSAQTPIQQQAFALRGWIDASIRQPKTKEHASLLKESIRYLGAMIARNYSVGPC